MSLEQAIADALDERAGPLSPVQPVRPADRASSGAAGSVLTPIPGTLPLTEMLGGALIEPLSERQREVAVLVARGMTNRQIGEALVITEGTANLHVKHILRKLGFSTRARIATWVTQQGLVTSVPVAVAQH